MLGERPIGRSDDDGCWTGGVVVEGRWVRDGLAGLLAGLLAGCCTADVRY